jgi:hypothetical protein
MRPVEMSMNRHHGWIALLACCASVLTLSCGNLRRRGLDAGSSADGQPAQAADSGIGARSTSWADDRISALVAQMTYAEKIQQLQNHAPAIPRLGVAAYEYWSEGLHGVLTGGATSFPQAIALASTWDPALLQRVASAISDEARGFNARDGKGLTYWSPVINMLRDPRWGRFEESYSEDPFLMARMGVAFVRGLQGYDPKYLKAVSTPKHFAANNSEYNRHNGSSDIDEQLLHEYYLPAFEATVVEGGAFSVMSAYNSSTACRVPPIRCSCTTSFAIPGGSRATWCRTATPCGTSPTATTGPRPRPRPRPRPCKRARISIAARPIQANCRPRSIKAW